ncbi:MAG TPA: hypothetical protein VKC62_09760 [Gaiellaceae bacterium]|nr:hypothetical protein [Gaiellaceae bacterium]
MSVAATPHFAASLLGLPVRVHGSRLGTAADLLVDTGRWRVLGYVVECRDEVQRFLPYAASQPLDDEIVVGSALMLLDDVGFYRAHAVSFRAIVGVEIRRCGHVAGTLADLVVARTSEVDELAVEVEGVNRRIPASGSRIVTSSTATAA